MKVESRNRRTLLQLSSALVAVAMGCSGVPATPTTAEALLPTDPPRSVGTAQVADVGGAVFIVDQRTFGLSILPPLDGSYENRVRIMAPGLPFSYGEVDVTIFNVGDAGQSHAVHQATIRYRPVDRRTELTLDLPATLPAGNYDIDARLALYGSVQGIRSGEYERVRRQSFTRGLAAPTIAAATPSTSSQTATAAPPLVDPVRIFRTTVAGYDLNQTILKSPQSEKWRQILADMKTIDVTQIIIEGHTCDIGTVEANEVVSKNRATKVEKELLDAGLPPTIPRKVLPMGNKYPISVAPDINQRRLEDRRVVVTIEYRKKKP
jgi:outer membrane protein OmpA-like peptidoglycan-associated protein